MKTIKKLSKIQLKLLRTPGFPPDQNGECIDKERDCQYNDNDLCSEYYPFGGSRPCEGGYDIGGAYP